MSDTTSSVPKEPSRLRPLVARAQGNKAVWLFVAVAAIGATALFASLESRRSAITAPAIAPGVDDNAFVGAGGGTLATQGSAVGPIVIPPEPVVAAASGQLIQSGASPAFAPPISAYDNRRLPPVRLSAAPPVVSSFTPPVISQTMAGGPSATSASSGPEVIYDAGRARPAVNPGVAGEGGDAGKGVERVQAGRFSNPATTVPKGTVIQAVLESALDSTRAGFARAIIQRDVVGFDGSKVLIPRGSRLIGEYKADLATGQNRALIQWQRLMRPDGGIINLDSPSADPLGRAGVKGKVNTHFLAQFGGAILQSALNLGQQVGVNQLSNQLGNGTTVYAIPLSIGSTSTSQATSALTQNGKVAPTLKVRQGTSVSVFVARDLDFTGVE